MVKDKYQKILDQFELYYPDFYKQADDWWASGRMTIAVKLRDGSVFEYNRMDNTIRRIRTDEVNGDDDHVAKEFSANLKKIIPFCGKTQTEIANELGITNAMLSRYIHGTSIPNAGKAFRIAKILGCTVDELFDSNYME